jgi:alanine racemase
MVRVGAGLYGIWPSLETKNYAENKFQLKPVLSWRTILAEVKNLSKGSYIGYDCAEVLERDSVIGICPIGYWHGYPRNLSSIGKVLIKGIKIKVLGRVSMDMLIVDLTNVKNPKIGDEITIIGCDGKEDISLEEVAILADTSSYEIVDRLNPLIERIYT